MARKKKPKGSSSNAISKAVNPPPLPRTENQDTFIKLMKEKDCVVATGPAGTGKSFLAACYAGWFYRKGLVSKIVLTRPTVPTGKSIGYFPGTLEEKMEPWVAPFMQALEEYLGKGAIETMVKKGTIEIVPFEVVRGRTFDNAFVILDEAQNSSQTEIKAFVTRQGEGSTTVINGDITQSDIGGSNSGLDLLLQLIPKSAKLTEMVGTIHFDHEDIVRSEMCKEWVKSFDKHEKNNKRK
jgi:phosphate starvation-inducible PhoH-like protein